MPESGRIRLPEAIPAAAITQKLQQKHNDIFLLRRSKICASLGLDRPVVSRLSASPDPSPGPRGGTDSDLAIFAGGRMQKLTGTYPWVLAFWLAAATATAFLILAHALHHGGATLT
jgi:hypothetical protein